MPDGTLQHVVDALRDRLQAELDAQLGALVASHGDEVARVRSEAERAADDRWSAELAAVRSEWQARLEAELAGARAEAEQQAIADRERVRAEAEQAAIDAQQALHAGLQRAEEGLAEANRALEEQRERAERELADIRQALAAAERQHGRDTFEGPSGFDASRLVDALAAIDEARTLSDILALTAAAAAVEAPRAALFVANGSELEEWQMPSVPALSRGIVSPAAPDAELFARAFTARSVQTSGDGLAAPAFAGLPGGRDALAVPIALNGELVGVLYADEGPDGAAPPAWQDAVQILGRHASARLACVTAVRTAHAMRLVQEGPLTGQAPAGERAETAGEDEAARRYARLLLSEIKLYNEAAVRVGREKRDLLRRLGAEIERARRLYEERIPASVTRRDTCFEQELVQTLADGDAALLG